MYKLYKSKFIIQDDVSPNVTVGEFNDSLIRLERANLLTYANYGKAMFGIYSKIHSDMHIKNVMDGLEVMEDLFQSTNNELCSHKLFKEHKTNV